jgi:hypothetical protein
MADNGGSMGFMGFILGGLVVVVAVLAFIMYGGQAGPTKTVNIQLPGAAAPK